MHKLTAGLVFAALLAGCVADQRRDHPNRHVLSTEATEAEVYRHGGAGYELAEIFNTGSVADARKDYSGGSHGLRANEFYTVEIAEDPLKPTVLTPVGYVRRLQEDRGDLFIYEFYDGAWNRIGYLNADGELYRYKGASEESLGRFEIEAATRTLYYAPSGYGYDSELQDRALVNMHDATVAGAEPRERGVHHRTHRTSPPVVVFTPKRSGEVRLLGDGYRRERFYERENEELNRIREANHGGHGVDEEYGGLKYKDGNPVKSDGTPMKPGDAGK
jgi:hypothetical protein